MLLFSTGLGCLVLHLERRHLRDGLGLRLNSMWRCGRIRRWPWSSSTKRNAELWLWPNLISSWPHIRRWLWPNSTCGWNRTRICLAITNHLLWCHGGSRMTMTKGSSSWGWPSEVRRPASGPCSLGNSWFRIGFCTGGYRRWNHDRSTLQTFSRQQKKFKLIIGIWVNALRRARHTLSRLLGRVPPHDRPARVAAMERPVLLGCRKSIQNGRHALLLSKHRCTLITWFMQATHH